MKGRKTRNLLLAILTASLVFNIYLYNKYDYVVYEKNRQNDSVLWSISVSGNNLANQLENILSDTQGIETWRIVLGENSSIRLDIGRINTSNLKRLEPKWSLLQFGLLRINDFLHGINIKFLEQGTYDITDGDKEKLRAVVEVYRKLYEEVESESVNSVLVIDELTEQMMLIDPNYAEILDRLE